jgi:multidrug efflux pump subunit AcrA (membrane-fusion protein)
MGVKVSFLKDAPPAGQAVAAPAVVVPKAAVRSIDGRSIVFVLNEDRVERRAVSVGLENGDQIELASGVHGGERVVVDGPASLKDGDRVKVRS